MSHSSLIFGARKYLRTPRLSILNSTTRGCSWWRQRRVKLEIVAALLNMFRYLSANCWVTCSVTSRVVWSPAWLLPSLTEPEPTSPSTEKMTASGLVEI